MFWGNLQEVLFAQALVFLKRQGLGGVLYVRRGRTVKAIKIENGEPVAVKTSLAREGILRYLWEKKRPAIALLSEIGFADNPFDEAISKKIIPDSASVPVLREIYTLRILDIFGWRAGEYIFWPAFLGGEMEAKLKVALNVDELVSRGIILRAYPGYLYQVLKSKIELPLKVDRAAVAERNLNLSEQYRWLLGFFDSTTSLAELLNDEKIPKRELIKLTALLYSTGDLKFMEVKAPPEVGRGVEGITAKPTESEVLEYARMVDKSWSTLKDVDCFSMFGINSHISFIDLQNRYNEILSRLKSPKFYDSASDQLKRKVDELSNKLKESYEYVRTLFEQFDRGKHSSFKSMLEMLTVDKPSRIRAEVYFMEGLQYLDANRYAEALDRFIEACKLRPQEGEYWAYRGYTLCKITRKPPDTEGEILDAFKRAKEFDPDYHLTYFLEGEAYSAAGDLNKARDALKVAQKLKPSSKRVAAKLRSIESQISGKPVGKVSKGISEREQLDEKIDEMLKRCRSEDLYEVLGVKEGASPTEIRQAYFKLIKEFHPDTLGAQFPEVRLDSRLREIIEKLQAAFEILSDPKKLDTYNKLIKVRRQKDVQVELENKRRREREFQKAAAMIAEGHYNTADAILEELIRESPELKYKVYGLLAKFLWDQKVNKGNASDYLNTIEQLSQEYATKMEAGEANPKELAVIYLVWGKMLKKIGSLQTAYEKFVMASKLDPTLADAALEKRSLRAQYSQRPHRESNKEEGIIGAVKSIFKRLKDTKLF